MANFTKLAVDLAKGNVQNFSISESNDVLRKALLERLGVEKIDYKVYRNKKTEIFDIIEETISPIINDRLEEVMGQFAEVKNVAFGDTTEFSIDNPDLFDVAVIADGTGNLRRQRLDSGKINVEMKTYGIAIYDEFYRFLAGRINWGSLVDKVVKSYEKKLAQAVQDTLYGAYNSIDAAFKFTGSYDEDEIIRVCQNIEALYGSATIVGTKAALRPLRPSYAGDSIKDVYNALGHVGVFNGYETVALTQSFKAGTYDFNLSNTDLLILPATSDKFVKIVTEGTPIILDEQNTQGTLDIEHTFIQKAGIAVSYTNKYGLVRLT